MKKLHSEDGVAIISVLLVFVVLVTLSVVVWYFAMFNIRQAIRTEHQLKAYYRARAGVEASLAYIRFLVPEDGDPEQVDERFPLEPNPRWLHGELGEAGPMFRYADVEEQAPESISVTISRTGPRSMVIESTAYFPDRTDPNRQRAVVVLAIPQMPLAGTGNGGGSGGEPISIDIPTLTDSGNEGADFLASGDDTLEWTDGNLIQSATGDIQSSALPVAFKDPDGINIIQNQEQAAIARFQAPQIHFESPVMVNPNVQLHLYSPLIVFHYELEIKNNSTVCFHAPVGEIGYVVFKETVSMPKNQVVSPGVYTFVGSVCLPANSHSLAPYVPEDGDDGGWDSVWL